jgi:hypothetical protein
MVPLGQVRLDNRQNRTGWTLVRTGHGPPRTLSDHFYRTTMDTGHLGQFLTTNTGQPWKFLTTNTGQP